jgi:hypothetical protein
MLQDSKPESAQQDTRHRVQGQAHADRCCTTASDTRAERGMRLQKGIHVCETRAEATPAEI